MEPPDLSVMSDRYRLVRKAVYEEASRPVDGSPEEHTENKQRLRRNVTDICDRSNLGHYRGNDLAVASAIWHYLWTRVRYAGIQARIASREISDIQFYFGDYENFCSACWDIEADGHEVRRAGSKVWEFLNRTGVFNGCQTIGNVPKLCKTVLLARKLKTFLDSRASDTPVIDFITGGHPEQEIWAIHEHLMSIGYTADLTAIHFMMDVGYQVIKPDIVITSLFLDWGWLHTILPDLPADFSVEDLKGKGKYGGKLRYTNERVYKPVIDLARAIAKAASEEELIADIGWATKNPLRELDIFLVKYGQEPENDWGIIRKLHDSKEGPAVRAQGCVG
jgi:hypothetical protein